MKMRKTVALVAAALVLGLVVGNVASGFAAPTTRPATSTVAPERLGLRLGPAMRDAGGRLIDVVAKLTGLTADEVADKRADGESFAAIAKAKGVDSAEVVDGALAVRGQLLDAKVKDGSITQDQADDALARMQERLTERVDSTEPCTGGGCGAGGTGGFRGGMGGGGRGMMGGNGGVCTQTTAQ